MTEWGNAHDLVPDECCHPNRGKGSVGTREERRWGGDPCGRPGGSIRPGGPQDTHKGPPLHPSPPVSLRSGASRASSLARHSPFRVAHIITASVLIQGKLSLYSRPADQYVAIA